MPLASWKRLPEKGAVFWRLGNSTYPIELQRLTRASLVFWFVVPIVLVVLLVAAHALLLVFQSGLTSDALLARALPHTLRLLLSGLPGGARWMGLGPSRCAGLCGLRCGSDVGVDHPS